MGKERIGLDTIAGGQFAGRPLKQLDKSQADPAAPTQNSKEASGDYLEGTRWLYDDEAEYKRAQKKLASEIAREKLKKDLAKKARIERAKKLGSSLKDAAKSHARAARSHAKKTVPVARRVWANPSQRKKALIAGGAAVAVLFMFVVLPQLNKSKRPSSQVLAGHSATPAFDTVLPNDNVKDTSSGKVAYEPSRGVASYTDDIAGTMVTVSQQALPEKFQKDPLGQLGKFAEDINAKDKLVLDEATAYSGLSAKGPQTTVLIKHDLLIFITADKKLPDDELKAYINSLK